MNRCSIPLSFRPLSPKFVGSTNTFRHSCRRHQSVVAQKVEQSAQTIPDPIPVPDNGATHVLVPKPNPRTKTKIISGTRVAKPDPHQFLATELSQLQDNLLNLLGAAHPGLSQIAQCYYLNPTKQLRPLLVLLFSRATNGLGTDWEVKKLGADEERERGLFEELSRPLRQAETLNEWNPSMPDDTASFENIFEMRLAKRKGHTEWKSGTMKPELLSTSNASHQTQPRIVNSSLILPSQLRLAHIVEMVNVASSLHENTTDADSSTPSSFGFGNKLSILGGDFLLGRASTALSRLGSNEVVELIASVISNLVEGEILQMHQIKTPALGVYPGPNSIDEAWKLYLKKTYFKTASLMAKGARAATVLGGCRRDDIWSDVAYDYSRNLGFAYQLVKDVIEYDTGSPSLTQGLATGPALYASEEHPELRPLIERNLSHPEDIEKTIYYVNKSSGRGRTRLMADAYAEKACQSLKPLPDSDAKLALEVLAENIVARS